MTHQITHQNGQATARRWASRASSRTLAALASSAAERYDGTALRHKVGGGWEDISYPQLGLIAGEVAKGLIALGIERCDRISILSNTRPEWTLADLGALSAGATVAPIYHTNSPEECQYVLAHSEARLVFCEDDEQLAKIAAVRERCPALEYVVSFEGKADWAMSLEELREIGRSLDEEALEDRIVSVSPDDLATLVYTSGTTGPPKGCMLTHANFVATMEMYLRRVKFDDTHTVFMFLPLAHVLARVTQMVSLDVGATIVFWEGDAKKILENLAEVKPTHFPSVPRVFEKIFTAAQVGIEDASPIKRAVVRWALGPGRRTKLADRIVHSKVRGLFGGNLQLALTGAAPIARNVLEFFDACGIPVLEGYGMTESCAASTLNAEGEQRFGTVGRPLPGTEVRLAADGEILMYGPNVFAGYYKDPEATAQTLDDDGWLRTGDLGQFDDAGFVSITGRKKDIIITSSGKNITPVNIENALKENRWISEAVVYGDRRPYLVALIWLDPDELQALPAERREAEIEKAVEAANSRFARIEQVKRYAIVDGDLSQAGGELTPTLKVKRNVVYEKYADIIDSLYA